MPGKERLVEAMHNNKPPMLRCWVNEHSPAVLFPGEAHVIIKDADSQTYWNIVSENKVILLGVSAKSDALGSLRDAYVQVGILFHFFPPTESKYHVELNGIDSIRLVVPQEQIVFAQSNDPIWREIKTKLEQETISQGGQLQSTPREGRLGVDISNDGSWVRLNNEEGR